MDTRRTCLVDAFTAEPLAGNAAGVVPEAAGLTDAQMRAVARELSVSETAFLLPSDDADRKVRYFTPTQEVDLCGHATIASHALLVEDDVIDPGTHSLETNVGVIEVEVTDDGVVWMTQDHPRIEEVALDHDRVADALGVRPAALTELADELPLAVASTGLPFLVVPVSFLEPLGEAAPDMAAVEHLADEVGATGVYAFTFDTVSGDATLHGRMFAPGAGVPEDPVTGTASGAVGAYLRHADAFASLPEEMRFEQGHFVDRPGDVRVRVGERVRVGGRAAVALDGRLGVPALSDGDIVEA